MREERPALAALERLRRLRVDAARSSLGSAVAEAERSRAVAEEARKAHAEAEAALLAAQQRAPANDAAGMLDAHRWLERSRGFERGLARAANGCAEAAEQAAARVELARSALVEAERRLGVVERHRERWEVERRRRRERAEEAEADDRGSPAGSQRST